MEDKHGNLIIVNIERLILLVDYNVMIKELRENQILTELMVQKIESAAGDRADTKHKNRLLFQKLIRQGPEVFQKILDIFQRNNFDDAVKLLSPIDDKELIAFNSTINDLHLNETKAHQSSCIIDGLSASTSKSSSQQSSTRKLEPFTTATSFQFIPHLKVKRDASTGSHSKMETYRMASKPRGVFFFVNIINFKIKPRKGAEVDRENLVTLFRELGFITFYYEDLTKLECFRLLEELVRSDYLQSVDSFVCCIQTHGDLIHNHTKMEFIDGSYAFTEDITNMFSNVCCPSLINKPKVFFFPFCRGKISDLGKTIEADGGKDESIFRNISSIVPTLNDVLICYGSVPGYQTHRDTLSGSWYINELCKNFAEHACDTHIENLLKMVSSETMKYQYTGKMQVASFENLGFNKLMFFNPMTTD